MAGDRVDRCGRNYACGLRRGRIFAWTVRGRTMGRCIFGACGCDCRFGSWHSGYHTHDTKVHGGRTVISVTAYLKTVTRLSLFFLSATCLAWAVYPKYGDVFGGLIVGVIAGLINLSHLAWRVRRIADQAARTREPKRSTIGFLFRACIALLAALVATKQFHFSLAAVIAGIVGVPLTTLAAGALLYRKNTDSPLPDERGDN